MKKQFLPLIAFSWLMFANSLQTFASETEYIEIRTSPGFEIVANGGLVRPSGYLTQADSTGTYGVDLNVLVARGIFAFSWQGFSVEHDTGEFALANNKIVAVRAFTFLPYVKLYEAGAFSAFAGIGFTQVNLYQDAPEYDITYGTMMLSGLLRYEINQKWSLHYKTNWYDVEQTMNGVQTKFEAWSNLAGVGYRFY